MTKEKDNKPGTGEDANKGTGKGEQPQAETDTQERGYTRSVRKPYATETVGDAERDAQHRENGTPKVPGRD